MCCLDDAEITGGIIYPIIAQRLIFRIGFPWTIRGISYVSVHQILLCVDRLTVMALIALLTLIPANIVGRQRPGAKIRRTPQMDWAAFRDVSYVLMMIG